MDIAKLKVADLKELLAQGRDIEALLSAMKGDGRVSVRKLADTYMKRKIKEEEERERVLHLYDPEGQYYRQGLYHVAGIDEAGRGPAAGPVMVAAVILPPFWDCPGLNDSKKVQPAKRAELYDKIMAEAVAVSCISKSEKDIDRLDIYHATMQAKRVHRRRVDHRQGDARPADGRIRQKISPVRLCRPQGIFDEDAYGSPSGIWALSDTPAVF